MSLDVSFQRLEKLQLDLLRGFAVAFHGLCLELGGEIYRRAGRKGNPLHPAGLLPILHDVRVHVIPRQQQKILLFQLGGLPGHFLGVATGQAEDDFVPSVGVNPGADLGWELPPVLMRQGHANAEASGLSQRIGEIGR